MATSKKRNRHNVTLTGNQMEQTDSSHHVDVSRPRTMPLASLDDTDHGTTTKQLESSPADASDRLNSTPNYELVTSEPGRRQRRRGTDLQVPFNQATPQAVHSPGGNAFTLETFQVARRSFNSNRPNKSQSHTTKRHKNGVQDGIGSQFSNVVSYEELLPALTLKKDSDSILCSQSLKKDVTQSSNKEALKSCGIGLLDPVNFDSLLRKAIESLDIDAAECSSEWDDPPVELEYDEITGTNLQIEIAKKIWQNILPALNGAWKARHAFKSSLQGHTNALCDSPEGSSGTNSTGAQGHQGRSNSKGNHKGKSPENGRNRDRDDEEGGNSQDSGGGGLGGRKAGAVTNLEHHELACPYNKLQPDKFCRGSKYGNKYQSCAGSFKDIAAIVQHLRERHYYNDKVCPRCYKQFGTKRMYDQHLRAESICDRRPAESIEGEMPILPQSTRRERLEKIGRRRHTVSNEEQWHRIWNALFPRDQCQDPHQRLNCLEREFDRAANAHSPSIVYDLVTTHRMDFNTAEEMCRRLTDAIRNQISPYFETGRGHTATPANNIAPPQQLLGGGIPSGPSLTDASSSSTAPLDHLALETGTEVAAADIFQLQMSANDGLWNDYDYAAQTALGSDNFYGIMSTAHSGLDIGQSSYHHLSEGSEKQFGHSKKSNYYTGPDDAPLLWSNQGVNQNSNSTFIRDIDGTDGRH